MNASRNVWLYLLKSVTVLFRIVEIQNTSKIGKIITTPWLFIYGEDHFEIGQSNIRLFLPWTILFGLFCHESTVLQIKKDSLPFKLIAKTFPKWQNTLLYEVKMRSTISILFIGRTFLWQGFLFGWNLEEIKLAERKS